MKDLFDTHISPMLIAENVAPFAAEEYVYEIKWDGERCVAFLDPDDGVRLENKRNVRMLPQVPELSGIHRQASKRCILDGELVCMTDGKPDFSVIQRRSLLTDKYRVELESKRHPAVFIAFDCLYYDRCDLMMCPLSERREYLRQAVAGRGRFRFSGGLTHIWCRPGNGVVQSHSGAGLRGNCCQEEGQSVLSGKADKVLVEDKASNG